MAAIEKIRRRSGLLIAIIGIALLVFVLEDLFQSQGRGRGPVVAAVDGDKISVRDYEQLKEKNIRDYEVRKKNNSNDPNANLTPYETYNVYNNTLEQMIMENIMNKEYDAAGFDVTGEELYDQLTGETTGKPHSWMLQYFPDGNGGVDKAKVDDYLQNLTELPAEYYNQWLQLEQDIKKDRLTNKFNNLVKASYFLPSALAQKFYEKRNVKASADIVAVRYANIPDSTVTITDADIKAYYNENKYQFETNERRDIEYVVFEVKPSEEDIQKALEDMQNMRADFVATDNVINFVNANSESKYDSTWLGRTQVPQQIEQVIFDNGNGIGYVTEIFEDQDAFKMARIVDMQSRPDSLMASHILIPFKGAYNSQDTISKEDAEAKANALLAQLRSNPKNTELFAELAKDNSTDPGSKDKGGDLGWFVDGQMVPEFNDFVVKNPVGAMGIVETVYGYHIIKVTDKTAPKQKVRLAYMTSNLTPSTKTHQNTYQLANEFVTNNRTYEQFNQAIEDQGLTKRTMPKIEKSTVYIPGLDNPREIIRWAFNENTKKGDVSEKIFELDNMMVVPALTGVVHEGYAPIELIAEQDKAKIINKKKGEMAVEKMKACGNDVDRMVKELGAEATSVSDISFYTDNLSNFGREEKVIGTILGMKEGQEVGPLAGNGAAFIIKNVKVQEPAATTDYTSMLQEKRSQFVNKANSGVYNALKNLAKIKDNRTDIF